MSDPARLVSLIGYKPGWKFKVAGPHGRFLCVFATTPDSHSPARHRTTQHQFEIPDPPVDLERWVFDCLVLVERHEVGEFLTFDGSRPFMPYHQDEGSPYVIVDRRETTP